MKVSTIAIMSKPKPVPVLKQVVGKDEEDDEDDEDDEQLARRIQTMDIKERPRKITRTRAKTTRLQITSKILVGM